MQHLIQLFDSATALLVVILLLVVVVGIFR